ncbi:MFS transporter [Massilia oculi]|uniref:MFS transporter n=1 Tax=Massilia hydrophila TaxID=3044279 RepID=A0ABS7YFR7_9BURK|nr:MFS transporter [Massilia oculi]MCA1857374.1 MFS transporter [Massilia oculi]
MKPILPQQNTASARFYPWLIAVLAMLVLLVTNGLATTGITAFDESLLKEFGWSRGQLKLRDLITLMTAGLLAPFAGAILDRFGVRRLLLCGSLLFAALYYAYGSITSLAQMYLIHAGFGLVLVCAGINVSVVMVSQWFVRLRGRAIGIALVGSSLGGVVFPPLMLDLVTEGGWRFGFRTMAWAAVILFVILFVLARRPEDKGMTALGAGSAASAASASGPASGQDVRYRDAIRTRSFWALTFVAISTYYAILAMASHLFLHMRDLGFDPKTAGSALGLLFGLGLISKFLFGFLADLLPPKLVFVANVAVMLVGLVFLSTFDRQLVWVGIVITGFGWGGLYTMIQLQAVNNFGVTDAGKILGTITALDAMGGGLGIWLTGVMFDHFGNYHAAFYLLTGLLAAALLASTQVRREIGVVRASRTAAAQAA